MNKLKSINVKYNESGKYLDYLKINGKKYGEGIVKVNIILDADATNYKIELIILKKAIPEKQLIELQNIENIVIYEKI